MIAMTIIFAGLSSMNLAWFPGEWWLWLLFGLVSEALIVLTTLRDSKFYHRLLDQAIQQEFDLKILRDLELQQKLAKVLEYRDLMVKEIEREADPVLDDYLLNIVNGLEDGITHLYHLAKGLDAYWHDPVIAQDIKTTPQELEKFQRLLAREKPGPVREELVKTVAAKQAQWETLQNLRDTMTKAQFQLENAVAAMGTVYTQVVLLGSKDVHSSRAQRLQENMTEQVRALEDVSTTMNEIYRISD